MECGYAAAPGQPGYQPRAGFYDAENMGRDSPGVPLLDMLAEVASQTLHSEKNQNETLPKIRKPETIEKKSHEAQYNLQQMLTMPATQLLKQFTIFHSEELKRQYSYTCALLPDCTQKYTSFASEIRARMSIKSHIAEHLDFLKNNPEINTIFVPLTTKHRKSKTMLHSKKTKKDMQTKKPPENLNKENKEVKPEMCTSYLRKILSVEATAKEPNRQKPQDTASRIPETGVVDKEDVNSEKQNAKFLGDHSYFEHVKSEDNLEDEVVDESSNTIVDGIVEENIMLMVVESDGVHVKQLPYVLHKVSREAHEDKINHNAISQDSPASLATNMDNVVENVVPAKPKGKAKFIGTSKEEREMALALMERIKKKGNPSGSNLQCRICDPPRSFTAPTTLVSHYRSHAGIKPYECRICRAVFTRRHSLKYHMLIHQNQTRFTCADCEKKFRHPSHFREHRRRHTGEAPFGCDDCGQRFKTRNTYKRHLKTRHGKVLTTSGELLCLSEEDFQKVKTNRRKKPDVASEAAVSSEDSIAASAIIQYQKCVAPSDQSDILKDVSCDAQDINDNGAVWMNYCDYESAGESHMDKTEFSKTELPGDLDKQTYDFGEDGSTNLQIMHSDILYNDDPLYSVDSINEYMDENYEDFIVKKECDGGLGEPGDDVGVGEESCSKEFDDRYSECIKNLEAQNDSGISYLEEGLEFGERDKIGEEEEMPCEEPEDEPPTSMELESLDLDPSLEPVPVKPEDNLDDATALSSEEKTVKIVPQMKVLGQQNTPTLQLLKKGKVTILGKAGQILNLSQNGKQNAILLLSTADPKVMKFLKVNTTNADGMKSVAVADK